jgi:hypothetical protein
VKTAKPGSYCDGNCLWLRVDEAGNRTWVMRVVVRGKRRNIGLGSTRLVSLKQAREEAARLRGIARKGGDPLEVRAKERRVIPTFEDATKEVHGEQKKAFENDKHAGDWLTSLDTHVFPKLGPLRVDHITTGGRPSTETNPFAPSGPGPSRTWHCSVLSVAENSASTDSAITIFSLCCSTALPPPRRNNVAARLASHVC